MKRYSSPYFVASEELLQYLLEGYHKDNDWAHATLTQAFLMPFHTATAVLRKEIKCFVHNRAFLIQDPASTA